MDTRLRYHTRAMQRLIHLDDVAPQPWKNGGGQTRELLAWPAGGDWSLRISLADIETDGPFSAFPGITRWFTVVQGRGVMLQFGSETVKLGPGSDPVRFDGAAAPGCTLIDGPTRDLNLMLRGGEGEMRPARPGEPWNGGFTQRGLYTAVPGTLHVEHGPSVPLPAGTLLWQSDGGAGALRFEPGEPAPEPAAWWLGYRPRISSEDYLALERCSETRNEFLDGEIFAMTGASERHNLLVGNLYTTFRAQLRHRGCEVYVSDMRLKVSATGLYTYPDVTMVCGEPQFEDAEVDTLLNPKVIVEVLSKSTEDYDRGTKFLQYRALPSLTEYLLVAQDRLHVEHYLRQDEGWLLTETDRREDVVELPSVGARLALADVYDEIL